MSSPIKDLFKKKSDPVKETVIDPVELQQQIETISQNAELAAKELEEYKQEHIKAVSALNEAHGENLELLSQRRKELDEQLKQQSEREIALREERQDKKQLIEEKIRQISAYQKEKISAQQMEDEEEFLREKEALEQQMETLRNLKKEQTDLYTQTAEQMDDSYQQKMEEEQSRNDDLLKKKEDTVAEKENELKDMEKQKEQAFQDLDKALKEEENSRNNVLSQIEEERNSHVSISKEQISLLQNRLESLRSRHRELISQLQDTKKRAENEISTLSSRYKDEENAIDKEISILKNDLDLRQNAYLEMKEKYDSEYQESMTLFNDLNATLEEKKNSTVTELETALSQKKAEYSRLYSQLMDHIDEKYAQEKAAKDQELQDLSYRLDLEKEQMQTRNDYLKERLSVKESEYRATLDQLIAQNEEVEETITQLEKDYIQKKADMNAQIDSILKANAAEIIRVRESNAQSVAMAKEEFQNKTKEIENQIKDLNQQINEVSSECLNAQKETDEYIENVNKKKNELSSQHRTMLNELQSKKEQAKDALSSLEALINDNKKDHEGLISRLNEKKDALVAAFDQEVAELNDSHQADMDRLQKEHQERMDAAQADSDSKISAFKLLGDDQVSGLYRQQDAQKADLDLQRANFDDAIVSLKDEMENRILQMQDRKKDLFANITSIHDEMEAMNAKHILDKEELEQDFARQRGLLQQEYEEKLQELEVGYGNPEVQLQEIRERLAEAQRNQMVLLADLSQRKQQSDEEYNALAASYEQEISDINDQLAQAQQTYADTQKRCDEEYENLKQEYQRNVDAVETFKADMDEQLQTLRRIRREEYDNQVLQNNQAYADALNQHQKQQQSLKDQYDEQVRELQEEANSRKGEYDDVLQRMNDHKDRVLGEYTSSFEGEEKRTKEYEAELNRINSENELFRIELQRQLNVRKDEIAQELLSIKDNYNKLLSLRREGYDKNLADINGRIRDINTQITDLEEEKQQKEKGFNEYRNEQYLHNEEAERLCREAVEQTSAKIKQLQDQDRKFRQAHSERTDNLKKQINEKIGEYEELLKVRPSMIDDENARFDVDLEEEKRTFSEKMEQEQSAYQQIIDQLNIKQKDIVDSLISDIESYLGGKSDSLRDHDKQINELSLTYERYIRDEMNRQQELMDQIKKAHEDHSRLLTDTETATKEAEEKFLQEKEEASSSYQIDTEEADKNYLENLRDLENTESVLLQEKDAILEEIEQINRRYSSVDLDIVNQHARLVRGYEESMKEIADRYQEDILRQQKELSSMDVISDDIPDLLK